MCLMEILNENVKRMFKTCWILLKKLYFKWFFLKKTFIPKYFLLQELMANV